MQKNTREHILEILKESKSKNLNSALDVHFKANELNKQERAYITNMLHQLYRYKLRYDALINLYCHKSDGISENARDILLIALTEIFCMQSIPLHASINEAVELSKKHASKEVALINAVLRKTDKEFPFKELDKEKYFKEIKFLYPKKTLLELDATYASLPSFLLDILRKQYGKDFTEAYLNTLNELPWYSYRFNQTKENWEEKRDALAQTSILHLYFGSSGYSAPVNSQKSAELFEEGYLSYQGSSSQVAVQKIIDFFTKEKLNTLKIWDACSGVGGKSLALAESGIKVSSASDISEKRVAVYNAESKRLGLDTCEATTESLQDCSCSDIDLIILDAPCSGTGTLCSNPDLRYKITKKSIKETIELQSNLLKSSLDKLANDGHIAYLTCSLNKNENENLIEAFCAENSVNCVHSEYIQPVTTGADTLFLAIIKK